MRQSAKEAIVVSAVGKTLQTGYREAYASVGLNEDTVWPFPGKPDPDKPLRCYPRSGLR